AGPLPSHYETPNPTLRSRLHHSLARSAWPGRSRSILRYRFALLWTSRMRRRGWKRTGRTIGWKQSASVVAGFWLLDADFRARLQRPDPIRPPEEAGLLTTIFANYPATQTKKFS